MITFNDELGQGYQGLDKDVELDWIRRKQDHSMAHVRARKSTLTFTTASYICWLLIMVRGASFSCQINFSKLICGYIDSGLRVTT